MLAILAQYRPRFPFRLIENVSTYGLPIVTFQAILALVNVRDAVVGCQMWVIQLLLVVGNSTRPDSGLLQLGHDTDCVSALGPIRDHRIDVLFETLPAVLG